MTQRVLRTDRQAFKAQRLDNGTMRAPARLTRVGVFTYHDPTSGKTWRELRRPEEVFSADSMASFELVPLLDEHHPEIDYGAVTSENVTRIAVGAVGKATPDASDPNYLSAAISVWKADTVVKVESGKQELSCGYFCDREPAPAGATYFDPVLKQDLAYDFEQKNIRGNHVAIVAAGRAGPGARILLDGSQEAAIHQDAGETRKEASKMEKITIDGVGYEVTAQVRDAINKLTANHTAESLKLKTDADSVRGERDGLKVQVTTLTADLAAARDPKAIEAKISERLEVVKLAESHGLKADGLDLAGVQRAVIEKLAPEIKITADASAEYVKGVFSTLTATRKSVSSAIGAVVVDAAHVKGPEARDDMAKAARDRFFKPVETK